MTALPSVTVYGDDLRDLRQLTTDIIDGDHTLIPRLVAECAALFGCTPEESIDRCDDDDIVQLVHRRVMADLDRANSAVQAALIDADETRRTG